MQKITRILSKLYIESLDDLRIIFVSTRKNYKLIFRG